MTFNYYSAFDHCDDVRLRYAYVEKMTVIVQVMCTLKLNKL